MKNKYLIVICFILFLLVLLAISGCAMTDTSGILRSREYYPKASDDAKILITLQSNKEKTDFFIDDKWIAKGRMVKVLINEHPHLIRTKPEGFIAKEDYIQPPYNTGTIVGFYYLIEDMEAARKGKDKIIQVKIIGYSSGNKTNLKRDCSEAIINAKLKAIERAGVKIEAISVLEDFQLKSDFVEAKSKGIIEPGYEIIEVGYDENGVYKVLLIGEVRTFLE
jgi:hypothetical protein